MCRNIKTLANFEPPATDDEIRASACHVTHVESVNALIAAPLPKECRSGQALFGCGCAAMMVTCLQVNQGVKTDDRRVQRGGDTRCGHTFSWRRYCSFYSRSYSSPDCF